jgi:hypothetical protein
VIGSPEQPLTWLGLPTGLLGWGAGLCGIALFVPGVGRRLSTLVPVPVRLPLLALLSALLSAAYFHGVLGGRPRIIDASTYLLEARTFATGHFSFATSSVSALFRGRFLLPAAGDPTHLAPIFPPGYPAVLSLAVQLGDYRLLGPVLALAITLSTAWLALLVSGQRRVAELAATLSVLCLALRYHTADTMSHGWSMLLGTLCLCMTALLMRKAAFWPSLGLGLGLGALAATRPLTALAFGAASALALLGRASFANVGSGRAGSLATLSGVALGLVPGLWLLGAHNHALTGHLLGSPQLDYYALADGPPGCFRLGLGSGCRVEHADVVLAQGGHGLTLGWMLLNTVHRLHWHALDLANCELLLPIAWYSLGRSWKQPATRALAAVTLLLPLAYAFFYFQGSYPGGGARFYSELLPLLHVALAVGLLSVRWVHVGLGLSLLGYAVHAAPVHTALPSAPPLQRSRTAEGLWAVDTDHAFNLAFVPGRIEAGELPTVIRSTHDSRRLAPLGTPIPALLEAEADWPLVRQEGAWSERTHLADACVSGGRVLRFHPLPGAPASQALAEVELRGVPDGRYALSARVWSPESGCRKVPLGDVSVPRRHQLFLAELGPSWPEEPLHLDRLELRPSPQKQD